MTELASSRRTLAGNTNTQLLKIIALVFMFIDHAGKMCFPGVSDLRLLGRIAFPIYCWCLVVGAHHTRSMPKYLLRIALIGLISQPLYMAALNHTLTDYNIFLTLFLALCGLWGLKARKLLSHIWAPAAAVIAAELIGADYGWQGVMLPLLLWAVRDSRRGVAAVMIGFCLYWGSTSFGVTTLLGCSLQPLYTTAIWPVLQPFLKVQGLAILALPFLIIPMKLKLRLPKWLGYAIYPAHLGLLIALEYMMGVRVRWDHLVNAWNQLIALF